LSFDIILKSDLIYSERLIFDRQCQNNNDVIKNASL